MLGHKTSLNKFKKLEIISSVFSNHNAMKLEINHKKGKNHSYVEIKPQAPEQPMDHQRT